MSEGHDKLDPSKATEFDVACYIIESFGTLSSLKLQMLLFYCQAFSLVWDDRELFVADFEAWPNGPMLHALRKRQSGMFNADRDLLAGKPSVLDEDAIDTVDQVLKVFGDKTSQWLSRLAREASPWCQAWDARNDGEAKHQVISKSSMQAFYATV